MAAARARIPEWTRAWWRATMPSLDKLLRAQITDAANPRRGGVPDDYAMYQRGVGWRPDRDRDGVASWRRNRSITARRTCSERIRLAARFLERSQSPEGNIDLLSTNFNSPPDTGFVVHNVGTAAAIAQMYGADGCGAHATARFW